MSRQVTEFTADTFVAAGGSNLHLLRQQAAGVGGGDGGGSARQHFGQVLVRHGSGINAASWNRNNRVVASGCADGTVHLLYCNGKVMAVLPNDGETQPAALGGVTSLSWSAGSKRLAAGSQNGCVYIYDMHKAGPGQGGPSRPLELGGHLGGVTAVEYQHEDKFLAVASGAGSVVLYPDPHRAPGASAVPLPTSPSDTSSRLCLSVAAANDAGVAAGSARGTVTVWDARMQCVCEEYAGQHAGASVRALSFVPLKPALLYSAGTDGHVCLQDRRDSGRVSTFSVGAPVTALMVKEDTSVLGVGTADGVVHLYDPRKVEQPLHSLRCGDGHPITALQWQHRYGSLSSRHHHRPSAAGTASAPTSGRADGSSHAVAPPSHPAEAARSSRPTQQAAEAAAPGPSHGPAAPAAPASVPAQLAATRSQSVAGPSSHAAPLAAAAAVGSMPQVTPLPSHRPTAAAAALEVTPLPSPRPTAAAAASEVMPLPGIAPGYHDSAAANAAQPQERQHGAYAAAAAAAADVQQRLQQLGATPMLGSTQAASWQQQQQGHAAEADDSPPERPAPSAAELNVTPLMAAPAARMAAGAHGMPPALDLSRLDGAAAHAQLCVSPLPGMAGAQWAAAAPGAAASPHGRNVLGERTNGGRHGRMVPALNLPLPAAGEVPPRLQTGSSFAENVSLPSPQTGPAAQQQTHGSSSMADAAKSKAASAAAVAAAAEAAVLRSGLANGETWSIAATPPATGRGPSAVGGAGGQTPRAGLEAAAAAVAPAAAAAEFSFATAQRSQEQLGSAAAGFAAACASVEPYAAGEGAGLAAGLRTDVAALHLDMLQQFQAQQASLGALVSQVAQQNQELSAEVAAMRKQLAALSTQADRRNQFLWL